MNLLHLSHIKRTYNANSTHPVHALKDISFDVNAGEYIAIMGESGAGKSTLLNIIATLEKASAGEILLNGQDLSDLTADEAAKYRREHLGFIFQHFNLLDSLSNRDNIYLPLVLAQVPVAEMAKRVKPLAKALGINKIIDRFPTETSGGQQQRVAIARVLMQNPKIILADEPTASLDPQTSVRVMNDLKMLNEKYGMTVVANLHSIELAQQFGERVIGIRAGQVVYDGKMKDTPKSVFTDIYNGGDGSEEAE